MFYQSLIDKLTADFENIPPGRKKQLSILATTVKNRLTDTQPLKITFICTHNSRRSQLAELWMRVAAFHYNIGNIETYSGGTEATAFNTRVIKALSRYGFTIERLTDGQNPQYLILLGDDIDTSAMYSKVYDDSYNPQKDFVAVMVCDQANEACPLVMGATDRIPLTYIDPKAHDNTPAEAAAYDASVVEIGREMLYVISLVADA